MADTAERDAEFAAENDRLWGPFQWVKCYECPPDANGDPVFHHRDAHH